MTNDRIRVEDGVFVHDWMVWQDDRGGWWAIRGGPVLFSMDQDDLLFRIARATNSTPDLEDLRGRLRRSIARAKGWAMEDHTLQLRDWYGGK